MDDDRPRTMAWLPAVRNSSETAQQHALNTESLVETNLNPVDFAPANLLRIPLCEELIHRSNNIMKLDKPGNIAEAYPTSLCRNISLTGYPIPQPEELSSGNNLGDTFHKNFLKLQVSFFNNMLFTAFRADELSLSAVLSKKSENNYEFSLAQNAILVCFELNKKQFGNKDLSNGN